LQREGAICSFVKGVLIDEQEQFQLLRTPGGDREHSISLFLSMSSSAWTIFKIGFRTLKVSLKRLHVFLHTTSVYVRLTVY